MNASVERELREIRNMPYGTARIAAAESIARRIEAEGPQEKLPEALLDLVEAYTFAGEGAKSFVVFARVLRLWDERPELFDTGDERNLFWEFKWIAGDLPDYPQISVAQAEAFLADMQRRFELAGHGLSSVRMSRFRWAWHAGQADAEQLRLAWISGLRDEFEDCGACTIGQQVDYFTESGRHAEAVELGLTQDARCNLEPTRTLHGAALSALLIGDADLADRLHRQAVASIDDGDSGSGGFDPAHGQEFELLARGGRIEQALRRLRNDYPAALEQSSTPLFRLRFLLGVLAGLSANHDRAGLETGLRDPERATVSGLQAWVRREAEGIAAQLDARNGTDMYARLVERALGATRAEHPLPASAGLDPGLASTLADGPDGAPSSAVASAAADPAEGSAETASSGGDPGDSGAGLFARAEQLARRKDYGEAARAYADAAQALEREGWVERSGLAYAEAAQCAAVEGEEDAAHALFAAAIPRMRTGDADPEAIVAVLAAWAPVAARMGDAAAQLRATAAELATYVEFDSTGMSDELAARRHAEWRRRRAALRDTLARSVASADPRALPEYVDRIRAIVEAREAAEEFAGLGMISDAAHAFWLAGRVQRDLGDTEGAAWSLESAFEGFTAARLRQERAHAAGELIELLRATGQEERAEAIVAQL